MQPASGCGGGRSGKPAQQRQAGKRFWPFRAVSGCASGTWWPAGRRKAGDRGGRRARPRKWRLAVEKYGLPSVLPGPKPHDALHWSDVDAADRSCNAGSVESGYATVGTVFGVARSAASRSFPDHDRFARCDWHSQRSQGKGGNGRIRVERRRGVA